MVLVNGRRLPEVLTSVGSQGASNGYQPPDVNFIPLSLVQQVQVLPASASALYSGNAVGGVIHILLRPDLTRRRTEITPLTPTPPRDSTQRIPP
ncbi:MAG: TonB-dependent receptor plug domain-containing protein [Candidatus Synoicihabitans palmerolidicus]|nr:TonB-dependent receptor plug domain-containing protein [Candidatus Synoicihabitans palmerolidicus]